MLKCNYTTGEGRGGVREEEGEEGGRESAGGRGGEEQTEREGGRTHYCMPMMHYNGGREEGREMRGGRERGSSVPKHLTNE